MSPKALTQSSHWDGPKAQLGGVWSQPCRCLKLSTLTSNPKAPCLSVHARTSASRYLWAWDVSPKPVSLALTYFCPLKEKHFLDHPVSRRTHWDPPVPDPQRQGYASVIHTYSQEHHEVAWRDWTPSASLAGTSCMVCSSGLAHVPREKKKTLFYL